MRDGGHSKISCYEQKRCLGVAVSSVPIGWFTEETMAQRQRADSGPSEFEELIEELIHLAAAYPWVGFRLAVVRFLVAAVLGWMGSYYRLFGALAGQRSSTIRWADSRDLNAEAAGSRFAGWILKAWLRRPKAT